MKDILSFALTEADFMIFKMLSFPAITQDKQMKSFQFNNPIFSVEF